MAEDVSKGGNVLAGVERASAPVSRWSEAGAQRVLAIGFWAFQFLLLTTQRSLMDTGDEWFSLVPRFLVTCCAIVASLVIARFLRRAVDWAWPKVVGATLSAALLAAAVHTAFNYAIFSFFYPMKTQSSFSFESALMALLSWFWSYWAVIGLLLALAYGVRIQRQQRDLRELRALADSAHLAALRYQLNPHFMFNALNSVVSLIGLGQTAQAQAVVENLSDFLRAVMMLDANEDIALAKEIALQKLYLGIEAVRFEERLKATFALPDALKAVKVPGLILQPLVENALRHGVAGRTEPTHLEITAQAEAGGVRLTVSNELPQGEPKEGSNIGLANVARRLQLRFGDQASFNAGPEDGRFIVSFVIPNAAAA